MEPAVVGALVAAFATAFGWIANHYLTIQRDARQRRAASAEEARTQRLLAAIRHVEAQLGELYGPIVFRLHENDRAFAELLIELGRSHVFLGDNSISEADLDLWLLWSDNVFLPNHATVCDLLRTKAHLIEGPNIPPSHLRFLDYYYSWKVYHDRWKATGARYRWHARENWPETFSAEVNEVFTLLKARHARFLLQLDEVMKGASSIARPTHSLPARTSH